MTIEQAISGIEHLMEKAAEKGKEFMGEEIVSHGNVVTGTMSNSVKAYVYSMWTADVVVDTYYAGWVDDGRGPVVPVRAKVLHWISPQYGSIWTKYAAPYPGSHFSQAAAARLAAYPFSLE